MKMVIKGTVAPNEVKPDFKGQIYRNVTSHTSYIATSTEVGAWAVIPEGN